MHSLSERVVRHIRYLLAHPRDRDSGDRFGAIELWPPGRCAREIEDPGADQPEEGEDDAFLGEEPPPVQRAPATAHGNAFTRPIGPGETEAFPSPEPITRSRARLNHLLRAGPRPPLNQLREIGLDLDPLFLRDPDGFLCLLETVSLFRALRSPAVRTMRRVLGAPLFRDLVENYGADFPHACTALLASIRCSYLDALADHLGPRLERTLRRALAIDVARGTTDNARSRLERLRRAYRIRIEFGARARRYEEHIGPIPRRREKRHLAAALLQTGAHCWEWILDDVIGRDRWHEFIEAEAGGSLQVALEAIPEIPNGATLQAAIGRDEIRGFLHRGGVTRALDQRLNQRLDERLDPDERFRDSIDVGYIDVLAGLGHWATLGTDGDAFELLAPEASPLLSRAVNDPWGRRHMRTLAPNQTALAELFTRMNSDGLPPEREIVLPVVHGETTHGAVRARARLLAQPDGLALDAAPRDPQGRTLLHAALGRAMAGRLDRTVMSAILDEAEGLTPEPFTAWARPLSFQFEKIRTGTKLRTIGELDCARSAVLGSADSLGLGLGQRRYWTLLQSDHSEPDAIERALRRGDLDEAEHLIAPTLAVRCAEPGRGHAAYRVALGAIVRHDPAFVARVRDADTVGLIEALAELAFERFPNYDGPLVGAGAKPGTRWRDLPEEGTPLGTDDYGRLRAAADSIRELERVHTGQTTRVTLTPDRGLLALFAGVHGEDCSVTRASVHRLRQPDHAIFIVRIDGRPRAQGYLSALVVTDGRERALLIDAFNPSNNVAADPEPLVKAVVQALGEAAHAEAGIEYVLVAKEPSGFSNRQALSQAAAELFGPNVAVSGFDTLRGPNRGFQCTKRPMRVAWVAP